MAKLLVVEDDEAVRRGLERLLSLVDGHKVRALTTAEAALSAIKADPPQLVITDVKLPGFSGLHLVEVVRSNPGWESIPFLVISASITTEIEQQIAGLVGVTYLRKPFDPETLQETVAAMLEAIQT